MQAFQILLPQQLQKIYQMDSMQSLLFTFSNQQLSQQLKSTKNQDRKLTDFLVSYQQKRQMKLRPFRSKKLKRYEQYLEDVQLDDCSFTPSKPEDGIKSQQMYLDDDLRDVIKPHSSKHIEHALRPKVSRNNRQLPPDFNVGGREQPKSMQLIRQQGFRDDQRTNAKKMREQIETQTKRRLCTSKDAPKIHFPSSDKKLPKVFRFRSISHDNVNTSPQRKKANLISSTEPNHQRTPSMSGKSRQQKYLNFVRAAHISDSEPSKIGNMIRRKKIESFCLNAEETPHFKQTID